MGASTETASLPPPHAVTKAIKQMVAVSPTMTSLSLVLEPERHPIALADRGVLRLVLVALAIVRRQRPHALRIVLRVLRVRVDLGFVDELEARGGDAIDHPLLREVPGL